MCEISLLVLTYNQNFEKLKITLNSILIQENVQFEIIISDDCSNYDCSKQLADYFNDKGFLNYKININNNNLGIIGNSLEAIKFASADVIKLISPGDFLADKNVLSSWLNFMKNNNKRIVFGDTVYYYKINNQLVFRNDVAMPQNSDIYNGDQLNKKIFSYIGLRDQIHGAAMMVDRSMFKMYLETMHKIGMKWCEDVFVYLAVLDDVSIGYFPKTVIWYEYDCGISSGKNISGKNNLKKDIDILYDYLEKRFADDSALFNLKKIVKYYTMSRLEKILFLCSNYEFLVMYFKCKASLKLKTRMTRVPKDNDWFYELLKY